MSEVKITNEVEIWMPVVGFEGQYEISNLGRVKTLARDAAPGAKRTRLNERILKTYINNTGYYTTSLNTKSALVHRLIAQAFIPNPNNYPVINHKNSNRADNRIDNLEWCTYKHNSQHMHESGNAADFSLDKNPRARPIAAYKVTGEFIANYGSAASAAIALSLPSSSIRSVLCGNLKSYSGYNFKRI